MAKQRNAWFDSMAACYGVPLFGWAKRRVCRRCYAVPAAISTTVVLYPYARCWVGRNSSIICLFGKGEGVAKAAVFSEKKRWRGIAFRGCWSGFVVMSDGERRDVVRVR